MLMTSLPTVEWREYDMAHGVCPQQIQDVSAWFQKTFK